MLPTRFAISRYGKVFCWKTALLAVMNACSTSRSKYVSASLASLKKTPTAKQYATEMQ